MSTTTLYKLPLRLSLSLEPVITLLKRHLDTRLLLKRLSSELLTLDNTQELLALGNPIESLQKQQHLYHCSSCGELLITPNLLEGEARLHACDHATLRAQGKLSKLLDASENVRTIPLGLLTLEASGPLDELLLWGHSLQLGLNNEFKGI